MKADREQAVAYDDVQDEIKRALERLYRLRRLIDLGAPGTVLAQARQLVAYSRERLGDALWAKVETWLPGYADHLAARRAQALQWRDRCLGCLRSGGRDDDESEDDASDASQGPRTPAGCRQLVEADPDRPCPALVPAWWLKVGRA